jgi:hypothetical protein
MQSGGIAIDSRTLAQPGESSGKIVFRPLGAVASHERTRPIGFQDTLHPGLKQQKKPHKEAAAQ